MCHTIECITTISNVTQVTHDQRAGHTMALDRGLGAASWGMDARGAVCRRRAGTDKWNRTRSERWRQQGVMGMYSQQPTVCRTLVQ